MIVYIVRRLILAATVLFAVIVFTFAVFFTGVGGGQAAYNQCGTHCTTSIVKGLEHQMGLDKPVIDQFGTYLKGVVAGRSISSGGVTSECSFPCLGWSFVQNQSVTTMVLQALPVNISMMLGGAVVFVPLALLMGVMSATKRGSPADRFIVGTSQVIGAIPYYAWALILNLYIVLQFGLLPGTLYSPITQGVGAWIHGMLAIWIIFGVFNALGYVRFVRAFMINTLTQDYVRTAKSKGMPKWRVTLIHGLHAATAPFITLLGIDIAAQLGGAIFSEQVFNVNGLGKLSINALSQSDLPVMAGAFLIGAAFIVLGNLVVDLIYTLIDPTVKLS